VPADEPALGVAAAALADAVALGVDEVLFVGGVVAAADDGDACAMVLGEGPVACGEVTLQLANTMASKKIRIASGRFRVGNINILMIANGRYCAVLLHRCNCRPSPRLALLGAPLPHVGAGMG
jgi:hypothetical protein